MQADAGADIFFGRRPVNPRLAWHPCFPEPSPDRAGRGNICHDRATLAPQPAIIFSLDSWRGRHAIITANGWHLHTGGGEYRWNQAQLPLPDPLPTCDPEAGLAWFRGLLHLDTPEYQGSWETVVRWILRALQPDDKLDFQGYPILVLTGPPNAGQNVAAKLLAQLLDPTREPVRPLSPSIKRIPELLANHHVLAFVDSGRIRPNVREVLRDVSQRSTSPRPVIVTTRRKEDTGNLSGHAIYAELPPAAQPIHPYDVWQKFEELRPTILGAVLTLLSRNFDTPVSALVASNS